MCVYVCLIHILCKLAFQGSQVWEVNLHVPIPATLAISCGRCDLRPSAASFVCVSELPECIGTAGSASGSSRDKVWLWKGKEIFCNHLK